MVRVVLATPCPDECFGMMSKLEGAVEVLRLAKIALPLPLPLGGGG